MYDSLFRKQTQARFAEDGLAVDVELRLARKSEFVEEWILWLHVNGSASVSASVMESAGSLTIPIAKLATGRNWIHAELQDKTGIVATSAPIAVDLLVVAAEKKRITGVLTLALQDADRALILLGSLVAYSAGETLEELLVIVPAAHVFAFATVLAGRCYRGLCIRLISEGDLIKDIDPRWDKYALQMALKLLAARLVATDYYLVLDADVIATGTISSAALLPNDLGAYTPEPRSIHPHWWEGSAELLGLDSTAFPEARFGVTPAILSTPGSLIALDSIKKSLEVKYPSLPWEFAWLASWQPGSWWSEYTLYRLALDKRMIFDKLHTLPISSLLCHAVWYQGQLPWDAAAAFLESDTCMFSLVQSSTQAPVNTIAKQVAIELNRRRLNLTGSCKLQD